MTMPKMKPPSDAKNVKFGTANVGPEGVDVPEATAADLATQGWTPVETPKSAKGRTKRGDPK